MKYLIILVYLLLHAVASKAQDTTLPKESFKIYPLAGKFINKVSLWKIDSNTVEYVKNGNLADINTVDVLRIESLNYRIEFDEHQKLVIRMYDLIILGEEDTVRGIIKKIYGNAITYIPAGKNNLPLKTSRYLSYQVRNAVIEKETSEPNDSRDLTKDFEIFVNDLLPPEAEKKIKLKPEKTKSQKTFEACCLSSVIFAGILGLLGLMSGL